MPRACFDASGHPAQQSLLVAGFVSSVDDWMDFDAAWSAPLANDDVRYFHTSEFAQSVGIFEGWKEDETRRRRLLGDLYNIIRSHVYRKFGTAVLNSELGTILPAATQPGV